MQKLNLRLDQLLLGFLFSTSMLGWYAVSVRLVELLNFVPDAIGTVLFPSVSGSDRDWAARTTAWMLRVTLLALSLQALALGVAARPVVLLIFGETFDPSVAPLIVGLPGAIFLGLAKVATKYIAGVGRPGISSACTAAGLVVGGLALVPLTTRYGLVGAALASDLGYATIGIGSVWAFVRLSGEPLSHCLWPSWSDLREVALRLRATSPLTRGR